jgi:probable phosphoglycerate mutase
MTGNLFEPTNPAAPDWFTAHCDGGSRGNPGPSGYGAVIEDPQGRTVARLSQFLGVQTNNYAEYSGLLAVLKWASENGVKHLRVVADSELMVNQMKGRYKVASPTLRPLWEEARHLAARLERFEFTHTLRGGNKEADRLANEAMDKGWKGSSQRVSGRASQPAHIRANAYERLPQPPAQVLQGYVKDGVVHLLNGELPEGTRVKITKE